ncbi:MAG: ATP-binding protein [Candidatus Pacebacteria bacterium]|nr:ATP-binding protein [Candidatus Paceibacterota bacterium]
MAYDILEKMYNQNPWWEDYGLIKEDYHLRELQKNKFVFLNEEFLEERFLDGVYIVTGMRQIGKTTHLKLLIQKMINDKNKENFLYFNCDILDSKKEIVELIEKYFQNFKTDKKRFIILDEITSVKDGILAIKYLIDKGENKKITYILTGSSTVNIKKTGEFLPGRRGKGKDFLFLPVSFSKFLMIQYPKVDFNLPAKKSLEKFYFSLKQKIPLQRELNNYLICGGIPRLINNYLDKKEIDFDNFNLYKSWIISETAKNKKREQIVRIILERVLASLGSDVSYNSFASDTGIGSHNTVYEYLNFLEDAFIGKQIYNYDYHQKKINFKKNKKIYLRDPFLFWLLNWWINGDLKFCQKIKKDPILKSKIAENLVFLHLELLFGEIFFYREKYEIDFIYKNLAWECKYQNKISQRDFGELLKFPGKKFVITKEAFKISPGLQLIPLELFLLLKKNYFSTVF